MKHCKTNCIKLALGTLAVVGATINLTSCMDKKNDNPFFSEYTTPH